MPSLPSWFPKLCGLSQVVDPYGQVDIEVRDVEVASRAVRVNLSLARDKRITRMNDVLEDRRPNWYFR